MLDQIQAAVEEFAENHCEVLGVFLFGSYAKGRQRAASDIDLAVYIDPGIPLSELPLERTLRYTVELEGILKKRVDLILLTQAPPMLRHQVFRNGRIVFERDRARVRRFMGDALVEFYDEIVLLETVQKTVIRRHLLGQ